MVGEKAKIENLKRTKESADLLGDPVSRESRRIKKASNLPDRMVAMRP